MDDACRQIANVMIYLFKQKRNTLTGFKVPLFEPHIEPYSSPSGSPSYLRSSPKVFDFLENKKLSKQKTKIRIVLMPRNDELKLKCPIEIARLSVKMIERENKSKTIDHFCEIEAEADKPDEMANKLNQIMAALVCGCLLSPFIGMDMPRSQEKKKKMVAQKFWITFESNSSEVQNTHSTQQDIHENEDGLDEIIVISPDRTLDGDKLETAEMGQREEQENLDDELNELNRCTQQSCDGSDDNSDQPFMGKTLSLQWRLRSVDCVAEISLLVHDNLNSICSFIKKTHLDEKSQKDVRRNRFFSEEIHNKPRMYQRQFRNERNNSILNIQHQMKSAHKPFEILKDKLIRDCLNRGGPGRPILSKEEYSRVELVTREEKKCQGSNFSESKWTLVPKHSVKDRAQPKVLESQSHRDSLKSMFQLSKFLKGEMRKEMRINKKRIRFSEQSMKMKRSDQILRNYFSEQKTKGLSEKYFSIREHQPGERKQSEKTKVNRKSARGSHPRYPGFEEDEEPGDDCRIDSVRRQFNTLIKFKRTM